MARVGMDWEVTNINIGKIFNFLLKPVGEIRVNTGMIRLFFWEPVGKIRVCIPFVWII